MASQDNSKKKRLSYMEAREWDGMEARIQEADAELMAKEEALQDSAVNTNPAALQKALSELDAVRSAVDALYTRWAELGDK